MPKTVVRSVLSEISGIWKILIFAVAVGTQKDFANAIAVLCSLKGGKWGREFPLLLILGLRKTFT